MEEVTLPIIDSCDGCGACCLQMTHPPFKGLDRKDGEHSYIPEHLKQELAKQMQEILDVSWPSPCSWLDTKTMQCKHYDYRPEACRSYRRNADPCLSMRDWFDIADIDK